jgi:Mo-dependent nitrogenase C-terminus
MSSSISSSVTSFEGSLSQTAFAKVPFDILKPLRARLDNLQIANPVTARRIAQLIPAQCPFERDLKVMGKTIAHIPPLCKLNPLYEEFVGLRFRALCYLADDCGEDITAFI